MGRPIRFLLDGAVRELPADAIARGVVPAGEIASVVGSVARSPIAADEPVLANRVGTATDQGATTGASPRAVRVVSLPAGGLVPSLRRGDRVDVIGPSSAGTTERLAAAARVVAIDDDQPLLELRALGVRHGLEHDVLPQIRPRGQPRLVERRPHRRLVGVSGGVHHQKKELRK